MKAMEETIRIGSRASRLAVIQSELVMAMYAGCAKLVTHRSTASSSEPMVTRLHGATVISIS